MKRFAKKVFDGGGKTLKNQRKSRYYPYKTLNRVKILIQNFIKKFEDLNQKLTFAAYDRIGGVGSRIHIFLHDALASKELDSHKVTNSTGSRAARLFSVFNSVASRTHDDTLASQKLDSHKVTKSTSLRTTQFIRKWLSFFQKLRFRSANCGAILIEFAVCMPILIILLFYIHDLVKIKRYYSQTEFVAQQMANIIQNIAKKRAAEGQPVSIKDMGHAAKLAYLSIYPGTTMYKKNSGHVFFHVPRVFIHYIESDSNGKASCKWVLWLHSLTSEIGHLNWGIYEQYAGGSTVQWRKNADPSSIYPTLKVEKGKSKIIIETQMRWNSSDSPDTTGKKASSAREAFGCYLVNPKRHATGAYFPSVVILTPYGGFSATKPTGG